MSGIVQHGKKISSLDHSRRALLRYLNRNKETLSFLELTESATSWMADEAPIAISPFWATTA
jgi:hypothetical protein